VVCWKHYSAVRTRNFNELKNPIRASQKLDRHRRAAVHRNAAIFELFRTSDHTFIP